MLCISVSAVVRWLSVCLSEMFMSHFHYKFYDDDNDDNDVLCIVFMYCVEWLKIRP